MLLPKSRNRWRRNAARPTKNQPRITGLTWVSFAGAGHLYCQILSLRFPDGRTRERSRACWSDDAPGSSTGGRYLAETVTAAEASAVRSPSAVATINLEHGSHRLHTQTMVDLRLGKQFNLEKHQIEADLSCDTHRSIANDPRLRRLSCGLSRIARLQHSNGRTN